MLTEYYDSGLALELTQPLWRNGFGRTANYSQQAMEAKAGATFFNEAFKAKSVLSDAESRYWRLAVAREVIRVRTQGLERAVSIRNFNARHEKLHLIDKSDLLQSEAAVKARQLDLQSAVDDERVARLDFNSARGVNTEEVGEKLVLPNVEELRELAVPPRAEKREDVRAAEELMKAASAGNEIAGTMCCRLSMFLPAAHSMAETRHGITQRRNLSGQHTPSAWWEWNPMPLDPGVTAGVRAGYWKEVQGAKY